MDPHRLTAELKAALTAELKVEAARVGFDLAAACSAVTPEGISRFDAWLAEGYAGEMDYLPRRAAAYRHPQGVLDGARSLLMVAMNYRTAESVEPRPGEGRVSRYAWGTDYHKIIRQRLDRLAAVLRRRLPEAQVRGVVDTAPLLEREFAHLAGLGWIGKNTLLLNKQLGSWFFLAALVTDVELAYDEPHATDHCGTCRACLDACPTQAFVAPYVLDARRCISYLTIELRGAIPRELRPGVGEWIFGCDVCQEVCPWNHRAPTSTEPGLAPAEAMNPVELASLFDMTDEQFRARFRHSPLWRARRRGLLRNAAIVLGNQQAPDAIAALSCGLDDADPIVRTAAAWALGRIDTPAAIQALRAHLAAESDADVRGEIESALAASAGPTSASITGAAMNRALP